MRRIRQFCWLPLHFFFRGLYLAPRRCDKPHKFCVAYARTHANEYGMVLGRVTQNRWWIEWMLCIWVKFHRYSWPHEQMSNAVWSIIRIKGMELVWKTVTHREEFEWDRSEVLMCEVCQWSRTLRFCSYSIWFFWLEICGAFHGGLRYELVPIRVCSHVNQ